MLSTVADLSKDEQDIQSMMYRIKAVNNVPPEVSKSLVAFKIDGKKVGKSTPAVAKLLCNTLVNDKSIFQLEGTATHGPSATLTLTEEAGTTCQSRSDAVMSVMEKLRHDQTINFLKGWRDELYPVAESFYDEPILLVERAATPLLGTQDYGVHINGLVRDEETGELRMWMARRSQSKSKYPGMLDHIVAGGQPAGMGLLDNVVKECEEEAGVPPELTREVVKAAGAVSYESYQPYDGDDDVIDGVVSRSLLFCYDMELPSDFTPVVVDGEVENFFQATIDEVKAMMDPEFDDPIKPNCYPVIVDYLLRAGHIDPDSKGYLDILRTLRSGYCG